MMLATTEIWDARRIATTYIHRVKLTHWRPIALVSFLHPPVEEERAWQF